MGNELVTVLAAFVLAVAGVGCIVVGLPGTATLLRAAAGDNVTRDEVFAAARRALGWHLTSWALLTAAGDLVAR